MKIRIQKLSGAGLGILLIITAAVAWYFHSTTAAGAAPLDEYPWYYLREGAPPKGRSAFSLLAVGDILPGRGVPQPEQALVGVAEWLENADLAVGNLECVLASVEPAPGATLEHSVPEPVRLYADPEAARWLRKAGFDALTLANNHALDGGGSGLQQTAGILQAAGLDVIGAGTDQTEALQGMMVNESGLRIGLLAVNAIPVPQGTGEGQSGQPDDSAWDIARWERAPVVEAVSRMRAQVDALVVFIHWGYEYQFRVDPAQEHIAEALFDAGADVVIGHHPHVVQEPVLSTGRADGRARLAAYSLGNFLFDQGQAETMRGLALRLFFDRQGLLAAQVIPIVAGPRPHLAPVEKTPAPVMQETEVQILAYSCDEITCRETDSSTSLNLAAGIEGGVLTYGEADLDGDGAAEQVSLEGGRLSVYHAGALAWTSPPTWQVVDFTLGDPDQDGRTDLAAIFWKADAAGVLRSHPFLIRQRGGRYEEVWGGSAVSEPILEVESGDLDGDGLEELIVLEQRPGHLQGVAVWRWHGWGFSLDWRSPPRNCGNLSLIEHKIVVFCK